MDSTVSSALTATDLASARSAFETDRANIVAKNAVTAQGYAL